MILKDNVLDTKVISKCPAIMFAVRRTERVIGRIMFLIVSIRTIKGINTPGVFIGTKCASIWDEEVIHPFNIKAVQKGRAKLNEILKWLVGVKI